ncbi:MAG: hypothetical protein ACM3SY_18520 [Candidatus Omnitrophota bacterium]
MKYVTSFERVGRRKGIKEGKKEGIKEEKIQVAIRMINAGFPIENIANISGLTEKEVKKLMPVEDTSKNSSSRASHVAHHRT